jgi:hypothetical protein
MYGTRLVIPSEAYEDTSLEWQNPQLVTETHKYVDSTCAEAEFHAWRERLITASCNGLLAIRENPGWLTLELVDYTDMATGTDIDTSADTYDPAWHGWVMDVHKIWQRFTPEPTCGRGDYNLREHYRTCPYHTHT